MGTDPEKLVFGIAQCLDCGKIVPAGVFECPHCHSAGRRVAVPADVGEGMQTATKKGDEAALHIKNGRFVDAIATTRQAVRMNPWNAKTHGNLGSLLLQRGEPDEAAECFERALILSPSLGGLEDQIAVVSERIGKSADTWMCHAFNGVFEFPTAEKAKVAAGILTQSILGRMTTRQLMPGTPAGLRLAGDSFLKAEIWFTVLALRACGSTRQMFVLPKTSKIETARAIEVFVR